MTFEVVLTALGIFGLIGLAILAYFKLFSRLVIEIVDNKHSFGTNAQQSNFVQNAVLFAYRPILTAASNGQVPIVVTENGDLPKPTMKVAPAPGRSFMGILGSPANAFAMKYGVRVIAIARYVWRPPPPDKKKKPRNPNADDSDDPDHLEDTEASPFATAYGGDDLDMTKAALGAFSSGDCRYIVGVVVSEAPSEDQLTYPSPLCEQLRSAGFTQFCTLPPLKTALRLRYHAGKAWRNSKISRLGTILAGLRFQGSCREVIRSYRLKPPRSPLIVEFYDPNSAIFYLPLADELDVVDSRHLTMRLPPELTCARPVIPLPDGAGILGAPPLPYKNMNAILTPWDPYSNEDPAQEEAAKKSKHTIERA